MKLKVLQAILQGAKTSLDIADVLGISAVNVAKYLHEYKRQGLVRVVGIADKEGKGRKAKIWELTERGKERINILKEKLRKI